MPRYVIANTETDIDAGYPPFRQTAINIAFAMAAIKRAEKAGIPSHRVDVTKVCRDEETGEDHYIGHVTGEEFINKKGRPWWD